jgi:hypothetical protein
MNRLLLIPDVHQDLGFVSGILERENPDCFEQVIFLGDYFDARDPAWDGEQATRQTAGFLQELVARYPRKIRLLWGNHDLLYCRLREYVLRVGAEGITAEAFDSEMQETFLRALWINETWPGEMWFRLELAVLWEDMLFSHAGIHPDFWPEAGSPMAALEELLLEWDGVIGNLFESEDHPLLAAGAARGGEQPVGGPLWLDWDREFEDALAYRQIVGHSVGAQARRKGRSWCIDCGQQGYGIVEDGELRILNLYSG